MKRKVEITIGRYTLSVAVNGARIHIQRFKKFRAPTEPYIFKPHHVAKYAERNGKIYRVITHDNERTPSGKKLKQGQLVKHFNYSKGEK